MEDLEIKLERCDERSIALARCLVIGKIISNSVLNKKRGDHGEDVRGRAMVNNGVLFYDEEMAKRGVRHVLKNCGEDAKMAAADPTQLRYGPGLKVAPIRSTDMEYRKERDRKKEERVVRRGEKNGNGNREVGDGETENSRGGAKEGQEMAEEKLGGKKMGE
ncbi:hypothetical protein CRYUN_Cryun07bG0082100 [Craigia yunnanensis]